MQRACVTCVPVPHLDTAMVPHRQVQCKHVLGPAPQRGGGGTLRWRRAITALVRWVAALTFSSVATNMVPGGSPNLALLCAAHGRRPVGSPRWDLER